MIEKIDSKTQQQNTAVEVQSGKSQPYEEEQKKDSQVSDNSFNSSADSSSSSEGDDLLADVDA